MMYTQLLDWLITKKNEIKIVSFKNGQCDMSLCKKN